MRRTSLSKAEVEQRVGRRHTEVLCSGSLVPECQSGSAWIWMSLPAITVDEQREAPEPRGLLLFFDPSGTLQAIKPLPPPAATAP